MILIPQIYLKNGAAMPLENTAFPLFTQDAFAFARAMTDIGSEALYLTDLNVDAVGHSPNLPIIKKIKSDLKIRILVSGAFRTTQHIEPYALLGTDLFVLDALAYQQPRLVQESCARFGTAIGVHIDVRNDHVTIPGYVVAAHKTAFDYAEQFREAGVKTFFYSNMGTDEKAGAAQLNELLQFCKKVQTPTYCTNEIDGIEDITRLLTLGAPRLEGLILGRSLYQGRIDLKAANSYVADLMQDSNNEQTLQDW